jgi:hypothetical protein
LLVALEKRKAAYTVLDNRFGVLTQSRGMTDAEVRLGLRTLIASYPNDVEPGLEDEFIQFRHFVEKENVDQSAIDMYKLLKSRNLVSAFPNVDIIFRIYLSLPATSAACERSFSVLKRIKNYNRSKMGQERLCSLAVMAIESDLLNSVDFDGLIHDFAESHSRKKALL